MDREGEAGKPGEPPVGQQGGKGGEGGKGGAGEPEGEGGKGGEGGRGAAGERGPRGFPGQYEAIHPWRWLGLTVWIIVFTLAVGYAIRENRENTRAAENTAIEVKKIANGNKVILMRIQRNRIETCEEGYEGTRRLFKPFFAGAPKNDVRLFNNRIDQLKSECAERVDITPQKPDEQTK